MIFGSVRFLQLSILIFSFLDFCCLASGQSTISNVSYSIFQKTMVSYSSEKVNMIYKPSNPLLLQFNSSETFTLIFYIKTATEGDNLLQEVDSSIVTLNTEKSLIEAIYNMQASPMTIILSLQYQDKYYLNSNSSLVIVNSSNTDVLLLTKINMTKLILQNIFFQTETLQTEFLDNHFMAIIQKDKTTNFMLPFNLISLKKYKVFVNKVNSTLQTSAYPNEPFLTTFWNELGNDVIIIPWLPYFSECTGTKKRILMKDLLKPLHCTNSENINNHLAYEFSNPIICETKIQRFECLIEEYNVVNKRRSEWFYSDYDDIFYFHPHSIGYSELGVYLQNSGIADEISTQMQDQIPVLYRKNINIEQTPKEFVFRFDITRDKKLRLEIVSVTLEANPIKTIDFKEDSNFFVKTDTVELNDKKVSLVVIVNYLTQLESFFYLHSKLSYYFIASAILGSLILALLSFIAKCSTVFQSFQTQKLIWLIMLPLLKGLALSILTIYFFILFFYLIAKKTNFSVIATTFDGDDSIESDLLRKYNGRIGVTFVICGFFLLVQTIRQTFKIPSPEEMKINLQDAWEQSHDVIPLQQSSSQGKTKQQSARSEDSLSQKDINFSIKTLSSRRNELSLLFFFVLMVFQYSYKFATIQTSLWVEGILWIVVMPIFSAVMFKICSHLVFNDLIYSKAAIIVYQGHFVSTIVLKSDSLAEFGFYWLIVILSFFVLMPLYLIMLNRLCVKMYNEENPNLGEIFLLKKFNYFIKKEARQSQYERGIYFSSIFISQTCSMIILPFIFLLLRLSFHESKIFSDIFVSSSKFKIIVLISMLLIPILVYAIFYITQWFDKLFDIGLFKIIELNHFTFKNRKVKWMADIFRQNPTIDDYLKEYQKFHFSSQLYFVIFSLAFAGTAVTTGTKIIFQNKYICFVDPALTIIFLVIWIIGDILAMVISFLAVKFKFYEKKEEVRMRTKLESIEKFLKRKDYTKYLDLKAVKQHFLYNYKDWVIRNIEKIFTKGMFLEENGKILKKFKFYKNLLKRKNMMRKRTSILEGNQLLLRLQNQKSKASERQIEYELQKEDQTMITVNGIVALARSQQQQSGEARVIKISKQKFNQFAKPLLYSWFYTAKQNILLKSLITKVKDEKLQEVCQFCNMDLDLENIEKHEIQEITNQFRVINVGRPFVTENFVQFYRTHQEFITVCFQCKEKKLYLKKKIIKNIKTPKTIMINWLLKCRSQMLHNQKQSNKKQKQE